MNAKKTLLFGALLISSLNLAANQDNAKELPFIQACLKGEAATLAATAPLSLGEKIKHWGIPGAGGLLAGYITYKNKSTHGSIPTQEQVKTILGVTFLWSGITKLATWLCLSTVAGDIKRDNNTLKKTLRPSDFELLKEVVSKLPSPAELIATAKTVDFVSSTENYPLLAVVAKIKSINPLTDRLRENFELLEVRLPEDTDQNAFRNFRKGLAVDAKDLTAVQSCIKESSEHEKEYARDRQERIDAKEDAQRQANIEKTNAVISETKAKTANTWVKTVFGKRININKTNN